MNTFTNNKNKELLYNLLLKNGFFSNLSDKYLNDVHGEFEKNILLVESNYSNLPLVEKNKRFMQFMIKFINTLKRESVNANTTSLADLPPPSNNIEEVYTAQDIKQKNLKTFETNLTKAQDDFNESMKLKTPENVSFNDNNDDDKPIENMEDMLAKTIAERNLVVQNIQYDETPLPSDNNIKDEVRNEITKGVTINEEENKVYEHNDNINIYKLLIELKDEQVKMKEQMNQIFEFISREK